MTSLSPPPSYQQYCDTLIKKDNCNDWNVGDRYECIRILGKGSYGEVIEAIDKKCNNRKVAIKRLLNIFGNDIIGNQQPTQPVKRLYREIHILKNLDHPQIIQLLDVICPYLDSKYINNQDINDSNIVNDNNTTIVTTNDNNYINDNNNNDNDSNDIIDIETNEVNELNDKRNKRKSQEDYIDKKKLPNLNRSNSFESIDLQDVYLVFEYVDTDLFKLFNSNQYLSNEHVQTFAYQLLIGLRYLHRANVIHRDIKPANILINEDCSLKICDFGLSRVVSADYCNTKRSPKRSPKCTSPSASSFFLKSISSDSNFEQFDRRTLSRHNSTSSANMPYLDLEKEIPLKRTLTKHVITRWYRAPEIILLNDYTSKVDIWSVGCILAELLGMQKDSVPHIDDRKALFPGRSCYPLSDEGNYDENGLPIAGESDNDQLDQLQVIFEVIGTPSDDDILRIKEASVRQKIYAMEKYKAQDLQDLYPGASPLAIDLLKSMLQFDPNKRISVDEALHHPYFQDLLPEYSFLENVVPMSDEIETSCEEDRNLRNNLVKEIVWFRQHNNMVEEEVDTDTELSVSTHSNQDGLDF